MGLGGGGSGSKIVRGVERSVVFPGGLDPERAGRLKDILRRSMSASEIAMQSLMQSEDFQRQAGRNAALQQLFQNMPPTSSGMAQSYQAATELISSPGYLDRLERVRQAVEIAQQRLGSGGLAAAQEIAAQHLVAGPELEQAAERIRGGHADELLNQAANLATSPEVREAIKNTDVFEISRVAEELRDQGTTTDVSEPEVEAGAHSEALDDHTSEENLRKLIDTALMISTVIEAALAAASIKQNPELSVETLKNVHAELICLLIVLRAWFAASKDEDA